MKTLVRVLLFIVALAVIIIVCALGYVNFASTPTYPVSPPDLEVEVTPERVNHGAQLAMHLCNFCHMGDDGKLDGYLIFDDPGFGKVYSPNITGHSTAGIGGYSDGELYYLFRTGIKRDGKLTLPMMLRMTQTSDEDIYSIIAFLRSDHNWVSPSEKPSAEQELSTLANALSHFAFEPTSYAGEEIISPDTADAVAYGKYLIDGRYLCYDCHSASFETNDPQHPDLSPGYLGGGNSSEVRGSTPILSANITMDEETGLGTWSENEFITSLLWGRHPNGNPIRYPMLPFSSLDTVEVHAIFEYLKTVPKISNSVPYEDRESMAAPK